MSEDRPSLVRIRVLSEQDTLRVTVDELRALTLRLRREGVAVVEEALAGVAKLLRELSAYVDLEELLVLPTVRNADVWGELRATALSEQHHAQRDELSALSRLHHWPIDSSALTHDLEVFVSALSESLARERRDVLESDLFRDDVVQPNAD